MLDKRFFDYLTTEKNYASHTISAYHNDLSQLNDYLSVYNIVLFEIADVKKIQHKMLRMWILELNREGLSAKSIARKLATCRTYFRFLLREGIIDVNPTQHLHQPKQAKRLPSFLKENETEAMLDQTPFEDSFEGARDRLVLELLYGCGIRRAELLGLKASDVDLYERMLLVTGKGGKMRKVPFGGFVQEAFTAYQEKANEAGFHTGQALILRKNGLPAYPKLIYHIVKKYNRMATPHTLRHTYATHLLENGADLLAIKELLGHSSLQATQVYTHNTIQKLKETHRKAHPRSEA
ncbi:MAG: tyrosine-type recombinase/integrase [Bacteroidota bacterium]